MGVGSARIILPLRQEAQEFFEFVAEVELLQCTFVLGKTKVGDQKYCSGAWRRSSEPRGAATRVARLGCDVEHGS